MFDEQINLLKDEVINSTCELIKIPSVLSPSKNPKMPFGENCNKALEYILDLGNKLGFRTKNIDGYCGYIEFGEGTEMIGIIGHLDVVPEGENWTYPPFSATISSGNIYGRGAIDDKGPVIASLYAMKVVMDTCKLNKRVRLILGLNEENDWKCIEYYKEKEETPSLGFSPDADFPCIYAEKGLLSAYLSYPNNKDKINIISIDCNNNAINVVPKYCRITLSVDNSISNCINNLKEIISKYNFNIDLAQENNNITLTSYGVSAHAAHPDLGKNAISQVLVVLHELFKFHSVNNELINYFYKMINLEYDGKSLEIDFKDESGALTLNVAQFNLENSNLVIGMNLRIPIHTSIETIKQILISSLSSNIKISFSGEKEPLYVSKESSIIKTLCKVFADTTGLDSTPIAIGGATYARAFPNFVSFGANMPGNKDMCHQIDEFISIDNLMLGAKIYANAIYELSKN